MRSSRDRKNSSTTKYISTASKYGSAENATFTMGRFFSVSTVTVKNSHSNGSGFVDIANNSKADEEMTSNDTVLVSNETETDIFANETTPQYVLMSQPLLTLNDSRSVLGSKSTLVHMENSLSVIKTVLLSRSMKSAKPQTLSTLTRTSVVDPSELFSVKMQSIERLKPPKVFSNDVSQTFNKEAAETFRQTSKTSHVQFQSVPLQVLSTAAFRHSQVLLKSSVQVNEVITNDLFKTKTSNVQRLSKNHESSSLHSHASFAATSQNSKQMPTSQVGTSSLKISDFSPSAVSDLSSPLSTTGTAQTLSPPSRNGLGTLNPVPSSSLLEKRGLGSSSLEASSIRKISGSEDVSHTIYSIPSEIPETAGISSSVVVLDGKENKVILSSEVLEQFDSTPNASWESFSLSSGVASPANVLLQSTVDSLPLSRLETPTIAQSRTENYLQSFSLVTESVQPDTQTLEKIERFGLQSVISATTEVESSISNYSRPSSSLIFTQGNKAVRAAATIISKSEEPSESADLADQPNVTVHADEDLTSPSAPGGFSKLNHNVYQRRTFSFVLPTPSATVQVIPKVPVHNKAPSPLGNTQATGSAAVKEERDEIPALTPRLLGRPILSDVSSSDIHSLTSFVDTSSPGVSSKSNENSNDDLISAKPRTFVAVALTSPPLKREPEAVSSEKTHSTTSMVLSSPELPKSAQSITQVTFKGQSSINQLVEADGSNLEAGSGEKASLVVGVQGTRGIDEANALSQSAQKVSSFTQEVALTIAGSSSSLVPPQFSRATLMPSLQQGVVTNITAVKSPMLLTHFMQKKDVELSTTEKNITKMSTKEKQAGTMTLSQQGISDELSVINQGPVWSSSDVSRNPSSAISKSAETNKISSAGVSGKQHLTTLPLLGLPIQTQISNDIIAPSRTLSITRSLELMMPRETSIASLYKRKTIPESTVLQTSSEPSQQQMISLVGSPWQRLSVIYSRQTATLSLSHSRPANISSTEFHSGLVSFGSTATKNSIARPTTTPRQASETLQAIGEVKPSHGYKGNNEIKVGKASVLPGTPFLSDSVKTDHFSKSTKATPSDLEPKSSEKFETKSLAIASTSILERLDDTLGKLQGKEKVVRTLASGIVASPVFHHAIRHIGELLKNETGLVHSVSRIESMLGHLQNLLARETRNHLRNSANFSLPFVDTAPKGNSSGEISKQVDSKLDGISTKLKRISSVLTELRIKRRENSSTIIEKSNIERPGNFTSVDDRHNRLIELLLKRFSKLEAAIQRKREFLSFNTLKTESLVSVHKKMNISASVLQHRSSKGSRSIIESKKEASTKVSSLNAATRRSFTPVTSLKDQISINALLGSKAIITHHSPITIKSTISISPTQYMTEHSLSRFATNGLNLDLSEEPLISPSSVDSFTSLASSPPPRKLLTSHDSLMLPTEATNSRKSASSSVRAKPSIPSVGNNANVSSTVLRPSVSTSSLRIVSTVVGNPQSVSNHHTYNKTHHVERSEEFTFVTFRSGMEAGVFTDRGKVKNMESCVERCYTHPSCHVAFMVGHNCYSIHCYSQKTCEILPVQSPIISTRVVYLKDRMLRLPYNTTTQPKASSLVKNDGNFTIKNCAKNVTVLKNMTFLAGMSAGNYTDYGTVDSIQACSNICCSKKVCDAAFMILNNCFTIDCISDKACHAIPSKSQKVNTSIVYFRKTLSTVRFQQVRMGVPEVKSQPFCPLLGGVREGVTFNGGIRAGNFTDHGFVQEFSSCIEKCCSSQTCDVAFMVENNCYSVKCATNMRRCLPVVARTTKFKTFMAVKKTGHFLKFTIPAGSNSTCTQNGPIQHDFTFRRGIKAGNFTGRGLVKNMDSCIQKCCSSSSCSAAFMIGKHCYSVICTSTKDCETVLAKKTNFITSIAFVNRERGDDKTEKIKTNQRTTFTRSILGGHCDVTDVQHNVNITGGWRAGKFLRISDIKDMKKCTEACCDYHGCGAAMFIDKYCYNLICFKQRGCQLIGSKEAFMIDKFVAVRKNLGHVMSPFKKAQIGTLTASTQHMNHSSFKQEVGKANKIRNRSTIFNLETADKTRKSDDLHKLSRSLMESQSIHPTRTRFSTKSEGLDKTIFNLNAKKHEIPFHISSHLKERSLTPSVLRTAYSHLKPSVASLHDIPSIGVGQTSYISVTKQVTNVQDKTQSVDTFKISNSKTLSPSIKEPPVIFKLSSSTSKDITLPRLSLSLDTPVTASNNHTEEGSVSSASLGISEDGINVTAVPPEGYSFKSDYSLLKGKANHKTKRTYACTHTFVFNNATLRGGLKAGDVKDEGKVEGMEECVEMCCKTPECNVALLLKENCYIVACFNKESCEAVPAKQTRGRTKVAYVARSKDETELIKQLISHRETSKTNLSSANKTKGSKPAGNKDFQSTDVAIRQGSCFRSPILRDVRFKLGRHAGDFKSVGIVRNVDRCVALCCKERACNAIFMLGSRCHLVSCSNEQDCQTVEAKSKFYKPTVVYLARSKVEVAYFFKLIPKEILGKYQNNATVAVNGSTDEDESAIRRSQLERPDRNISVVMSYSQRSSANVTVASKRSNVLTTLQDVTPSLSSLSVSVTLQPTLQSSNILSTPKTTTAVLSTVSVTATVGAIPRLHSSIAASTMKIVTPLTSLEAKANFKPTPESSITYAIPQEISTSFSNFSVAQTLTSSTTLTTPNVIASPQEHRKSLYQHGITTSNANAKSVTMSLLNPGLLSNVTYVSLTPLTITTIDRRGNESSESKTNTRSGLSVKHYSSQEITLEEKVTMANTTATPTPRVKSAIQAQVKMVVTDIAKSTDPISKLREPIRRVHVSPIKSPVAQVEASKVRSHARLTPKMSSLPGTFERSRSDETIATAHAAREDDVNIMITKVAKISSTNSRVSFHFASNYDHSTAYFATSHPALALARTEVETFPASLARHMSTVSLQSGSRALTAAHQQNENINESWRHIAQADSTTTVITSNVPSGELHANSSISIISHSNKSSYVTSIENKTSTVESTSWHFINEHKRGNIAMLRTSAFQKSHLITSHSLILSSFVFQINATTGTDKQQLMTVNKPKLANLKSEFQSSLLPISGNSGNTSTAQTLLLGTSYSKGMMMTRSKLNRPHYIQPSPTTRSRGSSSTSDLLLRESPSTGLRFLSILTSAAPLLTSSEVLFSSISIQRAITYVTSPSRGAEVHRTSTNHTLEITRTFSAYTPSSAQRINATTISTLAALEIQHMKTHLPASSIQSVLPKTSRLIFTLSTLLHQSNVVTVVMPTTAPGSKLLRTNSVNDTRVMLTTRHISYTLTSPTVSSIKKISYTLEGHIATKVTSSSSAVTKPQSNTTKNSPLSSTTRTIPLPTRSFKLSSIAPSKSMVLSREIFRTSSSLQPHLSTTTNASTRPSIASASLPRNVSSPHSQMDDSAVNGSSKGEFVSKETVHLSHSASQSLHHSKVIKNSFEVQKSVAMPPGNQNQTTSSLLTATHLSQSLQGFISNMAFKGQAIPRNGRIQDSEKQNISHDGYQGHQIDESLKTLRSNFPNIPQIKALNQSVMMLVSKTSRNASDFMSVKLLLNDIRNILNHREALLHSTPHSAARTTTQSDSTLSVPDEKSLNFSFATMKNIPRRSKSNVHGPSSQISSKATANHRNVSILFPPLVAKADSASSQSSHFLSEAKIQHSSSVELQKRVEIPFAGRLLEQIKVLQYSSVLKHRHTPTDSTPIAGGLLEQIRPLHTSPWKPLHTVSANLSQMSGDRASLITKPLASRGYTGAADKKIQHKATSVAHLQLTDEPSRIIGSSSQGVPTSTSVTEQSAKYATKRAGDIQIKSPNRATGVSRSKTSFTSQTASPSPKRGLDRPSPLRRTGPVTVITAIPSVMVKPLEIVYSKISTPVLTNTPAPKRFQSHPLLQGNRTLQEETSQTVKGTLDHSSTIPFLSTKSDSTEKTWHNEKDSMFGYFAKLLKSIKDILTKKNSRPDRESNATSLWNGPTPSYQQVTKATPFSSSLRSAVAMPFITPQQSVVTSMASSITPTKASSLQLLTSKVLDISLAMQPFHQVALNVTEIRQAALCEHSPSHENSTMRGGVHSGIFKEVAMVNNDAECISQCCISKTCDAAFLLSNRCFLVTCKNKMLCQSVPAKNVDFRPRVIYIENRMALAKGERNRESQKHSQFDINPVNISPNARFEASITSYQFSKSVKPGTNLNTTRINSHSGKAVCKASGIQQNVTLQGGIKSGNFKDQGTVDNMQKCIDLCCSIHNCSVAFMLLSRCFSVSCFNQTSCNSIPARSLIFQPQLAYLRRNVSSKSIVDNHFANVANTKTETSVMAFSSSSELVRTESKKSLARFPDNCRYSKSEKNVTLRGGLNAGSFLDTGVVDNITECVDNCCQATKCDVAFMIEKRCFLVTCYSSNLCQSIPTRNSGFTEIVHIVRDETAAVRDLLARLVQPSSPPAKTKGVLSSSEPASTFNLPYSRGSLLFNSTTGGSISKVLTLTGRFTDLHSGSSLLSRPPAVPVLRAVIESAIAPLNVNKQEIFGLIQTIGMSTRPVSARHALDQTITPSSLKFNSPSLSSQWSESVGGESLQEKQVESVEFSKDEICQSTTVFYNATMRGGINAGVFKDQGTVQNMRKCIEQCCRWQFCSVAFMLLTRCYIIACYNDHLCDPVPARNVTFTPRVAFVSRVQRDHGNLSSILENIPTPSLSVYQKSHLKTTGATNFTTAKVYSKKTLFPSSSTNAAPQLPSSLAIKPSPSQSSFSKVFSSRPVSRHHCTNSEQKHNVTLRGGLSAGHFKDRGKVADIQKCVDFCCNEDHCDVALMLLENCFTVICHNKRLCESVPAKTGRYKSRIVYVGKSRSHKSTQLLKHKLTKTISLLDAALPAMGEYNENETLRTGVKTTLFERTPGFESQQLTQLLSSSPSFEEVDQRSNISKVENLTSTKHFRNQSQTNKGSHSLIHEELLYKNAKSKQMNATASQRKHHHLLSTSVSSSHNTSLLFSSTIGLNASVWALPEPSKSAIERGAKSRHKSGLTSTFTNPLQHSFPQPSSCLSSPISYNVTLRNGIRSGYFRDQGRVENMGVCIQKCCDAEDCDVAFLLKQRCYLVTCYTKKGCETVPARHSLFRPRVSHVQRTNVSQLMSFMDEQDNAYSSGKTASVQSRSSTRTHFITPSSTLPAPVNSLDSSSVHKTEPKTSSTHKAQASPAHHSRTKHHKINTGKKKQRSGNLATQKRSQRVTVAPELKKRKSMKSKKRRRVKHKHKPKEAKSESSRVKMQHFELKMVEKKNQKLSQSDLNQLFHLMKPAKRVNNAHSMSDGGPQDKNSDSLTKTIQPHKKSRKDGATPSSLNYLTVITAVPNLSASKQDNYQTAVDTGYHHRSSKRKKGAPRLHRKTSASTHKGASKLRTRPNLAGTKPHSRSHKSQTILTGRDFSALEKDGYNKEHFKPTKKVKFGQKTTSKQKATHMTTKELHDHVMSRLATPTRTRLRLNTARQPTVMPPKVSSHRGSKFRETKSTVPSLPTQVPDLEISGCATGPVEYNQTLRGGLSSGLFHEVGKVRDIRGCSRHCCSSPICDLAFMVLNHCFLVTCSSSNPHMCDSTPALATNFNPMISRVSRSGSEDDKGKPTAAPDTSNKLTPTVKPLATPPKSPRQPETEALVPASNVTNNSTAGNQVHPAISLGNSSRRHPDANEGGEISVSASELLPSPPGCISSLTEHNVTLRGGLHAGKFTDAGKVDGSYTCTELCCKADNCDVAFFAFHRCFLVNCFDEYLCTSTPSLLPNFNPTLVHVYRHRSKPTPKPSTTLPPINYVLQQIEDETKTKSKSENKTCAHSEVYEEVTLRKGYKAGKFTSHGKVNSSDQCVDFCCGRPRCDLIFMFLNNCFTVSCSSGVACEIVSARQSRFKPRVVYLIKNNSTKLIKPSELNSSLSDPTSFVGKQPVNAVHYKELRSDKNNRDSYKKDFSQMSNDTETIDEEFTEVPDNKITSRTVINSAGNANSQHLKYNVSEHIVGTTPVDTLHKVLRSSKRKQESYKKNFTQMNNDTETVDEEFTKGPGNKITSPIAISPAVNASSQHQKHNVSNNLTAKSDIETTKQQIKDKHKLKLKSSEMTNHKESKTDEKMDLVLNKLTSVTEENKRLERDFHVLMAKQSKRRHKSKIASTVSVRGEQRKGKSKSSKNIQKKRIKYKDRQRMSRLGFSGNGSGMKSSTRKRVVIVDTDRPPMFPPTDEHNIEEHSIHSFQRKTYKKEHLRKSGKAPPKKRPLKKQHDSTETRLKHWNPTNEHDIEEHAIYSTKDVAESRGESKKNPRVEVEEGSEVKYGQPEEDTDDIELNEMLNLRPNNTHASRPEKPVWISSNDENKDDRESFHEKISPTPKSHFQFNDHTNKEHSSEDEFHIEHQDKSKLADKNVWMSTRNKDIDPKESFQEQIAPTHKSHFQLDNQKGLEHASEEEFHIQKQDDSAAAAKNVWMSSRYKNKDRLENFGEQIAPTHRSHFQLDKQKEKTREDEFDIDGSDKSEDSESRAWVSSRDRNVDNLESFHDQIAPTHKSNFQFENQKNNKNSREDKPHKDESDVSEEHAWKSTGNRNEDRLRSFDDSIAPTHRSNFQLDKQRENQSTKEGDFDIENHHGPEEPERHKSIGSRNKNEDQPGGFSDQVAPTSHFQFDKSGDNYNSNEDDVQFEDQVEPQVSEKHVWESLRNRSKDHKETENIPEQTSSSQTSRFQLKNQGKDKHINRDEFHIKQQHKPFVHEVAGGEPKNQHNSERQKTLSQNVSKKPEIDFTMSNSSEAALSELAESGKNIGTSQVGHGVEGPVFAKKDFGKEQKGVSHDKNEGSNTKPTKEMALTEKPLHISTSSSVTEHSGNGHETLISPHRKQANDSHEKPDFDAIYNKINKIYNRLQNLFDAQTRRERNTTLSSSITHGRLDKLSGNSKRHEEDIPTPPVSSLRPTTGPSWKTPPTNRVRVVKQFVTDDYGGAGVPPHRHRDALMDYIKTIYNRVQELYKRKLNSPRLSVLANHKRRKFHHILVSGGDRNQRKTNKGRRRSKKAKAKNYRHNKVDEEAVLKEMKRIYKNMKEMYHQQRKAQKKAKIMAKTSELQHQRSYIPSSYGTRESDGRTSSLSVVSAKPTRPGRTLNRPSPLTSSTAGARVKPQVHKTGKYPSCIVWFESETIKCERNAWFLRQVATSNKFI